MSNINWRVATSVKCFIGNDNKIYFADAGVSKYQDAIRKFIKSDIINIELDNSKAAWKLKIQKNGVLVINSSGLPDPNEWYIVGNFHQESLFSIIGSTNIQNGEIQDVFEIVFSDSVPLQCFAVCKNMKEWSEAFGELRRKLIVENSTKTSKFVPGHLYDLPTKSIIYLGKTKSHLADSSYNSTITKSASATIDLFLSTDNISEKSISEVFENRAIGEALDDIKYAYKLSPMVDSGQVLTDDWSSTDEENKLVKMVSNWAKKNKVSLDKNTVVYQGVEDFISTLVNTSLDYNISNQTIIDVILDVIKLNIWAFVEFTFNKDEFTNKTLDDNINSVFENYFDSLEISRIRYGYRGKTALSIFEAYGVSKTDVFNIVKKILEDFKNNYPTYSSSIKIFMEHEGYFRNRWYDNFNYVIDLRYEDKANLERYLKDEKVRNLIKDIHEENNNTWGKFSSDYKVKNEGTIKNAYNCCSDLISLQNILDYTGGKLSSEVENWILLNKVFNILILDKYNG